MIGGASPCWQQTREIRVVGDMLKHGVITKDQHDAAMNGDLDLRPLMEKFPKVRAYLDQPDRLPEMAEREFDRRAREEWR